MLIVIVPAPWRISTFGQVSRLVVAPVVATGAGAVGAPIVSDWLKRSPNEVPSPPDDEQPAIASVSAASGTKLMMRRPLPPVPRRMTS